MTDDETEIEHAGINPTVRAIFTGGWKSDRSWTPRECRCPRCARWVRLWDHVRRCGVGR